MTGMARLVEAAAAAIREAEKATRAKTFEDAAKILDEMTGHVGCEKCPRCRGIRNAAKEIRAHAKKEAQK